jgi:cytochrome c-type biogenesis protein CcmH/NrfF
MIVVAVTLNPEVNISMWLFWAEPLLVTVVKL